METTLVTFGVGLGSEAEWTNCDIGGELQGGIQLGRFERFP